MNWLKENIIYMLALIVTFTWAAITFIITIKLIEKGDYTTIMAMYSSVVGILGGVLAYWFSTTKGSKDKDEVIKQQLSKT
jgi:membrane associated rhomboid family serine protease